MYGCPKCGSADLQIVVEVWAKLVQKSDGTFETDLDEAECHDHEWTDNSVMACTDCGEQDIAEAFRKEES
jgi:predicted RNA-binding Zn-ribbon protein involved in translation (DUF1610 family)